MRPLEESLLGPSAGPWAYLSEELARRMLSWLDRQNFLISRRPPATSDPKALDAWLDRELEKEAME